MPARLLALILAMAFALAGCATRPDASEQPTTTPTTTPNPPDQEGPPVRTAPVPEKAMDFALTDCQSIVGRIDWYGPHGPGTAPPGWENNFGTGGLGSSELAELISCQRVSWGPFERPMSWFVESHTRVDHPESCGENLVWVINAIWTDDPEFNAYLTGTYNLPTKLATFSWQHDNSSTPRMHNSEWIVQGSEPSELVAYSLANELTSYASSARYAWDNGNGISVLDFNATGSSPNDPNQATTGTLRSPTMHAATGVEHWAGTADVVFSLDASGRIVEYGDYQCESP